MKSEFLTVWADWAVFGPTENFCNFDVEDFSYSHGPKKCKIRVFVYCSVCIEKLINIQVRKKGQNRLNIYKQSYMIKKNTHVYCT